MNFSQLFERLSIFCGPVNLWRVLSPVSGPGRVSVLVLIWSEIWITISGFETSQQNDAERDKQSRLRDEKDTFNDTQLQYHDRHDNPFKAMKWRKKSSLAIELEEYLSQPILYQVSSGCHRFVHFRHKLCELRLFPYCAVFITNNRWESSRMSRFVSFGLIRSERNWKDTTRLHFILVFFFHVQSAIITCARAFYQRLNGTTATVSVRLSISLWDETTIVAWKRATCYAGPSQTGG